MQQDDGVAGPAAKNLLSHQCRKPEISSFAQAITCGMVCLATIRETMPGMMLRFHIYTATSGGPDDPVI